MVQKFLLAALALILIAPTPSHAQRKGQTTEVRINLNSTSLFPRNAYQLLFFGDPRKSETDFTLRFQAQGVVAGCATMKKGRVPRAQKEMYKNIKDGAKIQYLGKRMKIAILDTDLDVKKRAPRYDNYDCKKNHNISFVDIPLNRDDLIKRDTNKIKLDSIKYGDFGEHEIDVNEDRLIFKVKTSEGEYWPTFWFFPANAIVLDATGSKQGENVTEMIREFGISHGLIPMEDVLEGYKLPHTVHNHVFFTDPSGKFINRLDDENTSAFVGKIKPTRTIYGVDGPREQSYSVDVHVSHAVQQQPE